MKSKRSVLFFVFIIILAAPWAFAQESTPQGTTTVEEKSSTVGYLEKEIVGIKPQLGALMYDDFVGDSTSRAMYGLGIEFNLTRSIADGKLYLGPSTGVFYSHLGAASSNFFGSDPDETQPIGKDSNIVFIPANLKVGYNFPDAPLRLSIHGGGNIVYRTVAFCTTLSEGDNIDIDSSWDFYPNIGADVEIGPVLIRPDWTVTPENDMFSLSLGAVFAIG